MSEAFPGMSRLEAAPSAPREASAVILFRRHSTRTEVFWIKREKTLRFAGGFYAFPGGKVDRSDASVPVADSAMPNSVRIAAAARELFEETGVLIVKGFTSSVPSDELLASYRRELLDKKITFEQILKQNQWVVDGGRFLPAGRWVTPDFLPVRFDAHFFLVELPEHAHAEVWPGELSEGAWVTPEAALSRWEEGSALLHPPNFHALSVMQKNLSLDASLEQLRHPPFCQDGISALIEFQRGIRTFPLKTDTLPPATHTNCYILGEGQLLLVDPGSEEESEIDRLIDLLTGLKSQGHTPVAIVLTHRHRDHISGAEQLARKLKLPIWAHEQTAQRVPFKIDRTLQDGDLLTLQGPRSMTWKVLHTPGHAQGHICLWDEASKAAVVGDMVAGVGTIVIDPPEGNMVEYLAQLRRLKTLAVGTLYPAHGAAIPDGIGKLDEYLQHRQQREDKLWALVPEQGISLQALVEKAYDDVPPFVWPLAERNSLAILEKLTHEGKVALEGGLFRRAGPAK